MDTIDSEVSSTPLDVPDGLHTLNRQINVLSEEISQSIVGGKKRGIRALLLTFFVSGILINVAVPFSGMSGNIRGRTPSGSCNDTWNFDHPNLNNTYSNCIEHYEITAGIVVLHCKPHQLGIFIDLRIFSDSMKNVRGIENPRNVVLKLVTALHGIFG